MMGIDQEKNLHTLKGNVEALFLASQEIGLEVNGDDTKLSREHKTGQTQYEARTNL